MEFTNEDSSELASDLTPQMKLIKKTM